MNRAAGRKLVQEVAQKLNREVMLEENLDTALPKYKLLFDASPARNIIREEHITPDTYLAAPGVPLCVNDHILLKLSDRIIHDRLQIGVATMLYSAGK